MGQQPQEEKGQIDDQHENKNSNQPLEELENKYKRALADYQNLARQTAREKEEFAKYANELLVLEILPIYDNLKTSVEHFKEAQNNSNWLDGIKHILKQFQEVLKNFGIEEIEALGKTLDTVTMEAVDGNGDKVIKVLQNGYKLNGKVIKAAKVEMGQ